MCVKCSYHLQPFLSFAWPRAPHFQWMGLALSSVSMHSTYQSTKVMRRWCHVRTYVNLWQGCVCVCPLVYPRHQVWLKILLDLAADNSPIPLIPTASCSHPTVNTYPLLYNCLKAWQRGEVIHVPLHVPWDFVPVNTINLDQQMYYCTVQKSIYLLLYACCQIPRLGLFEW